MKYLFILVYAFLNLTVLASERQGLERSIAQITVYSQPPDFDAPWRKKNIKTSRFLGVMVRPGIVLISAHSIAYQSMIELNLVGDSSKVPMEVELVDFNVNLALLRPREAGALKGMTPIDIGPPLKINEVAALISGKNKQRLSRSPARLHEVSLNQASTSSYSFIFHLFEVRKTHGLGWSEPVLDTKGRLTGLAVGQDSDFVYAIPLKIIDHFLKDWMNGSYQGFPMLGLRFGGLDSPFLRRYLDIPQNETGVLITSILENSPYLDKLKVNDVLLKIGRESIGNNGYFNHKRWGRVHFIELLANYYAGDEIKLTVLRSHDTLEISANSRPYDQQMYLIPGYPFSGVKHLVFGGLLFQELNLGFLNTWGKKWQRRAPVEMVYKYLNENKPTRNGNKRIIILNRVLPDPHNKGYQGLSNVILLKVNGREVDSIPSLREALKHPRNKEKPVAVFEFYAAGGKIVLDYHGISVAHGRIAKNYQIHTDSTFFKNN